MCLIILLKENKSYKLVASFVYTLFLSVWSMLYIDPILGAFLIIIESFFFLILWLSKTDQKIKIKKIPNLPNYRKIISAFLALCFICVLVLMLEKQEIEQFGLEVHDKNDLSFLIIFTLLFLMLIERQKKVSKK